MTTPDLLLRGIAMRVGEATLLSGIDLNLRPGELCGLIGPSGAGKTTLIRILLGIREPSAGSVSLGGQAISSAGPVGYVPQDDALHSALRVEAALGYAAALRCPDLSEAERAARVDQVCAEVGLSERRTLRIGRLSGGQRKRVSVAMELLSAPPILILDEPTSGLDPGMEAQMMALFSGVASQGHIVLCSTHAMQSLDRCAALIVLVGGRLAYFGPPDQALDWFQTDTWVGLFEVLGRHAPVVWARKYESSPLRAQFAARSRPAQQVPLATATAAPAAVDPKAKARAELEALKARLRGGNP